MTETICIPKIEYIKMKQEIESLKKTKIYKRLLEFEENIKAGKIFTREELGF